MIAEYSLGYLSFNAILNVKTMSYIVYSDSNLLLSGWKKARRFLTAIKYLLFFYWLVVGLDLGVFYRLNGSDLLLWIFLLRLDFLGLIGLLLMEFWKRLLLV
jgi:hypothetical protein